MKIFKKNLTAFARNLHKMLAYFIAIGLIWLTISGLLLNHAKELKLSNLEIKNPWLLRIMQIAPLEINNLITLPDGTPLFNTSYGLFWKDKPLSDGKVISAHEYYPHTMHLYLLITNQQNLLITTSNGQIIENLPLPEPVNFCHQQELFFCPIEESSQVYQLSSNMDQFKSLNKPLLRTNLSHEVLKPLPIESFPNVKKEYLPKLQKNWKSPLSIEALIINLHNGRIIPNLGYILLDIFGIILLIFILTGMILKRH